jgi:hypothetical protein
VFGLVVGTRSSGNTKSITSLFDTAKARACSRNETMRILAILGENNVKSARTRDKSQGKTLVTETGQGRTRNSLPGELVVQSTNVFSIYFARRFEHWFNAGAYKRVVSRTPTLIVHSSNARSFLQLTPLAATFARYPVALWLSRRPTDHPSYPAPTFPRNTTAPANSSSCCALACSCIVRNTPQVAAHSQ